MLLARQMGKMIERAWSWFSYHKREGLTMSTYHEYYCLLYR